MPKTLDDFEDWAEEDDGTLVVRSHPRLDLEYLAKRTQMFIRMTQRKGAPMVFGAQRKDSKSK